MTREWLDSGTAHIMAAGLMSMPVLQLTTGSLFVDNHWTAMLVAGVCITFLAHKERNSDAATSTLFMASAAVEAKSIAFAWAAPLTCWVMLRSLLLRPQLTSARRRRCCIIVALLLFVAAPPYITAFIKTGNPVFPALNGIFGSPLFATSNRLAPEYHDGVHWITPYEVVFHTSRFLESHDGAVGLFLAFSTIVSAPLMFRKWPRSVTMITVIALSGLLITWTLVSYVRYILPTLVLTVVVVSWAISLLPGARATRRLFATCAAVFVLCNVYLLSSAGYWHKDFVLSPYTRAAEETEYTVRFAPSRYVAEYMNAAHPDEPALYLINGIALLKARSHIASVHDYPFWTRLQEARTPEAIERLLETEHIRYIVAPVDAPTCGERPGQHMQEYLTRFTKPCYRVGCAYVAERRSTNGSGRPKW